MSEYNFYSGNPDPGSFPAQGLADAAQRVLPGITQELIKYPERNGYGPLREIARERFQRNNGIDLPLDSIAITSGSFQAVSLATQTFMRQPGDVMICEEYTYMGSLGCFRKYGADLRGIPIEDDGMNMDILEETLSDLDRQGKPPKFIYTIATNQNPTGIMMSEPKRHRLLELANRYQVPVVDDDCYADLVFERNAPPSLYSLDPEHVVYIGSFSKILGPGVRMGFVSAQPDLLNKVLYWKIDGGSNNLAAAVAAEYLREHLWDHVNEVNNVVEEKLNLLMTGLDASKDALPWHSVPKGGLFIWVKLPEDIDVHKLKDIADAHHVLYATGRQFHAANEDVRYLRLAYGYASLDDIRDGVPLLADCVREAMKMTVAP